VWAPVAGDDVEKEKNRRMPEKNWKELKSIIGTKREEHTISEEEKEMLQEAETIYETISKNIEKGNNGLYWKSRDYNGLIGILAISIGKAREAERLYELSSSTETSDTADIAARGILAAKLGKVDRAKEILNFIEERVPTGKSGLYWYSASDSLEDACVNAMIGILAFVTGDVEKAKHIYDLIEQSVPKTDGGMYYHKAGSINSKESARGFFIHTDDNAMIGALLACLGRRTEAKSLYWLIKQNIPQNAEGMYCNEANDSDCYADPNAAMGILSAIIGGSEAWG
jgi:tetratricopeptide (TPR) repeat protein